VSCDGVVPLSRSLDHAGPLCRTVTDTAILHAVLTGAEPLTSGESADLKAIRLGVPRHFLRDRIQPEIRECFDRGCERLAAAGATVVSIHIDELDLTAAAYLAIVLPEAAEWHAPHLNRHPDRYSPGVRTRLEAGRYVLAEDYVRAQTVRARLTDAVDATFASCDAIALPGLAITPQPIGAATVSMEGRQEPIRAAMLRLTQPFNMSGHPAISIPCGRTADGWPCGFQLVGTRKGRAEASHPVNGTRALLSLALRCEAQLT
jgi:aspartyl-tRNA(Asn)/glutamyl-tRNA(Gln) amidotransferase subunit A